MGYCIDQKDTVFKMKADNLPKALAALKAIAGDKDRMGGGSSSGDCWFSWCDMSYVDEDNFGDAFAKLNWDVREYLDDDGNIIDVEFVGEKSGDDEYILNTIAPFVEPGSYIEMHGEDGALWRWFFDGKTCEEKSATVTWE